MKNYIKTIILVVVLLAVGYFLLPYVKNYPKHPTPSSQTSSTSGTNSSSSNSSSSTSSSNGIQTFTSSNLGVSFQYNPDQDGDGTADTTAAESGDKVYVYYTASPMEQGQWVEKFTKDPSMSLADAIQKQFLSGVSSTDCFVADMDSFYTQYGAQAPASPQNFERDIIAYPFPTDPNQPFDANASKCPATYSLSSSGLSYFAMDKNHPDQYYFFNIGQYAITADTQGQLAWQDTFEIK
ncbi:MAG TPA: hypothetical protein VFX17_00785 [Patescibacteria group bacterium]|nr:hypothetical protein [Patescibacteria group bacterium]